MTGRAWVKNGLYHWQARCRCGWFGQVHGCEGTANDEAEAHTCKPK